jgi:hypothetical protein
LDFGSFEVIVAKRQRFAHYVIDKNLCIGLDPGGRDESKLVMGTVKLAHDSAKPAKEGNEIFFVPHGVLTHGVLYELTSAFVQVAVTPIEVLSQRFDDSVPAFPMRRHVTLTFDQVTVKPDHTLNQMRAPSEEVTLVLVVVHVFG